ncbi:MAG: lipid-A-disaccharide synthase [Alphaproteobacteria bacterium 64-11]|nr:MAG: lipid-A-disaccharide synthase [Alphaproteobacteria bacterium 64-11]
MNIMLVCGEPSGDLLGAQLMAGLKALAGDRIGFCGVGGAAMAREGLKSLYPLDATAVMGLREVVPAIPRILRHVRIAVNFALETRPDVVVVIDSPDFTHRVARGIRKRDPSIRTVDYVAPQVWASRPYRARAMARYFDLVLALLPFEPAFFEKYGLKTVFVGHPAVERRVRMSGGEVLRAELGIGADAPVLALLPGSRSNEIRFMLPPFRETVEILARRVPGLVTLLPTVPHVAARVRAGTQGWPTPLHIIESEAEKYRAFDAATAALAASGTVTTELALARTPLVAAYRLGWLTYRLMNPLITVRHMTLVDILLDRMAVPEFYQGGARPEAMADALVPLLTDARARAAQIADLDEATHLLGKDDESPSLRAAQALLEFVLHDRVPVGHS